jgi:putative aldouronate transport system substrate-binding protein
MTKRFFALLLSGVMAMGLLAGCGNETAKSLASDSNAVPEVETTKGPAAQDMGSTLDFSIPVVDSSEEAIDPASTNDPSLNLYSYEGSYDVGAPTMNLPLTTEDVSYTLWLTVPPNMGTLFSNGMADHPVFQKAEEFTGIHIDFLEQSAESASEKFNLMLVSGDYPDLVNGMDFTGGNDLAVESDFAVNIADYIADYAPNYQALIDTDPSIIKNITTDEGNVVAFYTFNSEKQGTTEGAWIRSDWLEDLGLENPKTYDQWEEVLTAFKNQKGAEEPLMMPSDMVPTNNFLAAGFGINGTFQSMTGAAYPYYVEDGEVKFGPLEEGYREYVQLLVDWTEKGLISNSFIQDNSNPMGDVYSVNVSTGRSGIFFNGVSMISMFQNVLTDADPNGKLIACYDARKNEDDVLHTGNENSILGRIGITITTACDDLELAMKWCDFWYTQDGVLLTNYGLLDERLEARDIWDYNRDDANTYPSAAALTADEADEHSRIYSDINTYMQQYLAEFITGSRPMEEWDSFVEELISMGIEDCIELKQDAYDRYMAR